MAFTLGTIATAGSSNSQSSNSVTAETLVPVTYDTDTAVGLRGYRLSSTQLLPEGATAAVTIGTAAGQARNIRLPQQVKIQEQTYRVSSAIATFDAFTVPTQGQNVILENGAIVGGANAADTADVIAPGALLFAVSADGSAISGLYTVVSGSLASLNVLRVDSGNISVAQNHAGSAIQSVLSGGTNAPVAMQFAVYTYVPRLANETHRTIEVYANNNVLSGAYEDINSTNATARSQSIADAIQADRRAVACSTVLSALHSPIGNRDYYGDSSSRDYLIGDLDLYMHGMGTSDRTVYVKVSHYAGYYPGRAS
jgi:hypothetical protein